MVNRIAKEILARFAKYPQLQEEAGFRIRMKGEEDKNRRAKFKDYQGPDEETIKTLEEHVAEWTADPLVFWNRFSSTTQQFTVPQAYPVLCYLRASACDDV